MPELTYYIINSLQLIGLPFKKNYIQQIIGLSYNRFSLNKLRIYLQKNFRDTIKITKKTGTPTAKIAKIFKVNNHFKTFLIMLGLRILNLFILKNTLIRKEGLGI